MNTTPLEQANAAALAAAQQLGMQSFGSPTSPLGPVGNDGPISPPGMPSTGPAPAGPEGLPPSGPGEFSVPPLSSEETQALREIIYARLKQKKEDFELPDLPITDEDRDRFGDCLARRRPFAEECSMMGGKLKATFRTKTKRENDVMFAQIDQDFKDGLVRSEAKYVTLLNNYNLVIQTMSFQGAPLMPAIPPGIEGTKGWSLANVVKNHVIESVSEPLMFLLIGALSQFDQKVRILSREAMKANFSTPVDVS